MAHVTRRTFVRAAALGAVATGASRIPAHAQAPPAWKVGGFTKEIQDLSFEETARAAVESGWDGIELPLRAGGQVLPDRVEEDLPRLVAALRARGQDVLVLATDVRGPDALSERVLRAAARAGIRLYRTGYFRYREGVPIPRQLDDVRAQVRDLAALNAQLGVTGLMQNHSGNGYVGSALWDLHAVQEGLDPRHVGVHFDIGHATVESGLSWPTGFALVKERIGAVIVKDFRWQLAAGRGGSVVWCPIGQGMIQPRFFGLLRASGFTGPLTLQFEYPFENPSVEARVRAFRADTQQVRAWIRG